MNVLTRLILGSMDQFECNRRMRDLGAGPGAPSEEACHQPAPILFGTSAKQAFHIRRWTARTAQSAASLPMPLRLQRHMEYQPTFPVAISSKKPKLKSLTPAVALHTSSQVSATLAERICSLRKGMPFVCWLISKGSLPKTACIPTSNCKSAHACPNTSKKFALFPMLVVHCVEKGMVERETEKEINQQKKAGSPGRDLPSTANVPAQSRAACLPSDRSRAG